jgi:hypothetical protein
MRLPRRLALLLPLALAAGCAGTGTPAPPALRFATALEASDPAVDTSIATMDAFERRALREERAVAFALGRAPGAPVVLPPGPGAAEAAGGVLAPAFTALGDYAHVLGQVAGGESPDPRPSPGGQVLAQAVAQALPATSARLAPPVREAGLAGVAALAELAPGAARRRPASAQALAREAAPHLDAVVTLLQGVIGPAQGEATRGAIRARRDAMEGAHARLLEAARRDPGLGAAGRYALFHQVAALRDQDPLPGTLASIVTLLGTMREAHAAIAAGDPSAEAKVAAFEAALAPLAGDDAAQDP